MKCEDLQLNLSTYLDDILTEEERATLDEHLTRCPVCRQKLADFQSLRASLRALPRPALSNEHLARMRNQIEREVREVNAAPRGFWFMENLAEFLQMRVMPYSLGTAFSLVFGALLLWNLLSAVYVPINNQKELARLENTSKPTTMMLTTPNSRRSATDFDLDLSAADYANTRLSVSGGSPSVNPHGALVALTKSLMRGKMKDDELVVVADVFGDGLAQIAEVVEPSSDIKAVAELEKALKEDPSYAPFVPASFDKRSETVRVIFKINRVDIQTNTKPKNRSKKSPIS